MKIRTMSGLLCAAFLLLLSPREGRASTSICDSIANNLVSSCGFESGTAWSVSGNDVPGGLNNLFGVEGVDPFDGIAPHSGNYQAFVADLVDNATTFSQTITTIPGGQYTVSLFLAQDTAAAGTCNVVPCANEFDVTLDGITVFDYTDVPVEGYTEYIGTVDVSDASSVLNITLGNDLGEFLLDDVSVVATPEPSSLMLVLGVVILGCAFRLVRRAPPAIR